MPLITYSPKVFIPLTKLCRDVCHYCTFAQPPRRGERVEGLRANERAIGHHDEDSRAGAFVPKRQGDRVPVPGGVTSSVPVMLFAPAHAARTRSSMSSTSRVRSSGWSRGARRVFAPSRPFTGTTASTP